MNSLHNLTNVHLQLCSIQIKRLTICTVWRSDFDILNTCILVEFYGVARPVRPTCAPLINPDPSHSRPHMKIGHLSNFYKALNWHANVHYSYLKNMYCSTSVPQKCFFSWLDGSHPLHRKDMQRPSYPLMIAMHPGGTTIPSQNWAICDLMEFLQYQKRNLSWKFWAAFSLKGPVRLICNWILRISKLGSTNEY